MKKSQVDVVINKAVRAVGTMRPKFNPNNGKLFSEELNVIGTAFWLKDYNCLVTCAHIVDSLMSAPIELAGLLVVGNAGNYKRAIVEIIDEQHDLAILKLLDASNNLLTGTELEKEFGDGLSLASSYPQVSTGVAYAGFPLGDQLLDKVHSPTYVEGVIGVARRDEGRRKQIQVTGPVIGGLSGAPIVLKSDQSVLVGVLSNSPTPQAGTANIFMGTSWEHVKALAELTNS